jgi:hypothetical protein
MTARSFSVICSLVGRAIAPFSQSGGPRHVARLPRERGEFARRALGPDGKRVRGADVWDAGAGRAVAMGSAGGGVLCCARAEARAGKYSVAQCGWSVGADATGGDSDGGAKFPARRLADAAADPFDGAPSQELHRDGQGTVSATASRAALVGARPAPASARSAALVAHACTTARAADRRCTVGGGLRALRWPRRHRPRRRDSSIPVSPRRARARGPAALRPRRSKWCSQDPGPGPAAGADAVMTTGCRRRLDHGGDGSPMAVAARQSQWSLSRGATPARRPLRRTGVWRGCGDLRSVPCAKA